jgi:hypothetical protein
MVKIRMGIQDRQCQPWNPVQYYDPHNGAFDDTSLYMP